MFSPATTDISEPVSTEAFAETAPAARIHFGLDHGSSKPIGSPSLARGSAVFWLG